MDTKEIDRLHHEAMDLAEQAFMLTRKNKKGEAKPILIEAFNLEVKAIAMLETFDLDVIQPSLAIMSASASWLAFDAELFDNAKMYANKVIKYNVDNCLVNEAYELLNDIP